MFSKQSALSAAIMLFMDEEITEEDIVAVYSELTRKNPIFPYWKYARIEEQLKDISEGEFKTEFRFNLSEIEMLLDALKIPEYVTCTNGTKASGMEAFLMLCKRYSYPCRLSDMIARFGRSVPEISLILAEITDHMITTHGHLLRNLNQPWLQPFNLENFAAGIYNKGAALDNCWGFIDGTVRPICRPGESQRVMYNGHKRVHALKFQSVVAPNGLIANLFGPVEGKRHDSTMLRMSGLMGQLEGLYSITGQPLCIYGDPAYPLRVHLQTPYKGNLTIEQQHYNTSMSSVRMAVEWVFNDITSYFSYLDFKKNLKIVLSPVGNMYLTCGLFRNALTCLYGSTTSTYFDINPPTLHEYFQA